MKQNTNTSPNPTPLIIAGLSKKYYGNKNYAIKDVSFKVEPGEFHGFIGANGAGKTTTIKSIIGAYAKYKGDVRIFGHKNSTIAAKKRIGYIPEVANFPKELSAFAYLKNMSILAGIPRKEAAQIARQKLVEIGLEKFAKRNPNRFSSGQKKKILLAQALIGDPDLIIMDEPASNLDPQARKDFFANLKKLQKKGKSIFISSHILVEIAQYVDAITIIDNGKILYSGEVEKVLEKSNSVYVFKFKKEQAQSIFIRQMKSDGHKVKVANDGEVFVDIQNNKLNEIIKMIALQKLEFNYVKKDVHTLQNVYDNFVVKNKERSRFN